MRKIISRDHKGAIKLHKSIFASILSIKENYLTTGWNEYGWEEIEVQDEGGDERYVVTLNELKPS